MLRAVLCHAVLCRAALCCAHSQGLQGEHDELEKAFRKEKKELEEKYAKLYGEKQAVEISGATGR